MKISVVTPAFNEEKNLPLLAEELLPVLEQSAMDWEWLIFDDHSEDNTFSVATQMAQKNPRIRCARMAKNYGSHALALFGFQQAQGDCAVLLAADLQDPPAAIPKLVAAMQSGAHIVWHTRAERDDPPLKKFLAKCYYFNLRHIFGIRNIPPNGGDLVLVKRCVLNELKQLRGENINFLAALAQLGFRQEYVPGERRARLHGHSNYTFAKNIKLFFDTISAHSSVPLRAMTALGFISIIISLLYALNVIIAKLSDVPVEGWTSLMLVILFIGGVQMMMMGVIGEYLWRAMEASKHQPLNIIEEHTPNWNKTNNNTERKKHDN